MERSKECSGGEDDEGVPVYNGNTGIIVDITKDNNVIVDFNKDVYIQYTRDDLEQLDLAYAINIFKMQGSSAKVTILLTPTAHTYFMNRNLIYTAITRTEEKCYHFATEKLINIALRKSANKDRKTFLKSMLLNDDIKATVTTYKTAKQQMEEQFEQSKQLDHNGLCEDDIPF